MYKGLTFWQDKDFHKILYAIGIFIVAVVIGYIVWKY